MRRTLRTGSRWRRSQSTTWTRPRPKSSIDVAVMQVSRDKTRTSWESLRPDQHHRGATTTTSTPTTPTTVTGPNGGTGTSDPVHRHRCRQSDQLMQLEPPREPERHRLHRHHSARNDHRDAQRQQHQNHTEPANSSPRRPKSHTEDRRPRTRGHGFVFNPASAASASTPWSTPNSNIWTSA